MFSWLTVVVIASSVSCVISASIKQNSPTYVPARCFLDKAKGSCRDYSRSYYFNVTAGYCQPFLYGGCGGNWNRFNTLSACHRTCTCATPPETGPCRGHIRRWFYSPADGCCRPFIYGGCGGNSNSYATWTECSEMCGYPTADSSWWQWGAQWGNWSGGNRSGSQSKNGSYSSNDFMRDWMLWAMLSGGEFEMEDLATLIGQAHIMRLGQSMARTGASTSGGFGFGSQMREQEFANGFNAAGIGGNMQSSGMANWGQTSGSARPGSFTPLGHIGSIANMINGEASEWMGGAETWGQMAALGLLGSANKLNGGIQGSFDFGAGGQRQGWGGAMGAGMSGQNRWDSQGQSLMEQSSATSAGSSASRSGGNWMHGEGLWNRGVQSSDFINMGSGAIGYMGQRQGGHWNTDQTGTTISEHGIGNTAIEILHLISQIGRGSLGPSDLMDLGLRYGAVSPNGNVDVNLLATRMVAALQGPRGGMNMSRLKGVAQRLGALDHNGNINIQLMIKGMTEKLSDRGFGNGLGGAGFPSLDEFNWLGSGKGSGGSATGTVGTGSRGAASGTGTVGTRSGGGASGAGAGEGRGFGRGGIGPRPLTGGVSGIRLDGSGTRGGLGGIGAAGSDGLGLRGSQGSRGRGSGTAAIRTIGTVEIAAGGGGARMGSYGKK